MKEDKKIIIGEITKTSDERLSTKKPNYKSRYETDYFSLPQVNKYVGKYRPIYMSSLERKFMMWCELSPSVKAWNCEPFAIGYAKGNEMEGFRQGNYYIDFVVDLVDGGRWLVEVKPISQTIKGSRDFDINMRKWNAAIQYVKANGLKFLIVTENFKPFGGMK